MFTGSKVLMSLMQPCFQTDLKIQAVSVIRQKPKFFVEISKLTTES